MADPVRLRDVLPADVASFFEHHREPEAVRMSSAAPKDEASFHARWDRLLADPTVVVRTIDVDGACAGYVASFLRANRREVCYWLGRDFWGRGIATAALEDFLAAHATGPLEARVLRHNAASRRVLEKCGFRVVRHERFTAADGREFEEHVFERP